MNLNVKKLHICSNIDNTFSLIYEKLKTNNIVENLYIGNFFYKNSCSRGGLVRPPENIGDFVHDKTLLQLSEVLLTNKTIKFLYIGNGIFTCPVKYYFLKCLKINNTITCLHIRFFYINKDLTLILSDILKKNILKKLYLGDCYEINNILKVLENNTFLEKLFINVYDEYPIFNNLLIYEKLLENNKSLYDLTFHSSNLNMITYQKLINIVHKSENIIKFRWINTTYYLDQEQEVDLIDFFSNKKYYSLSFQGFRISEEMLENINNKIIYNNSLYKLYIRNFSSNFNNILKNILICNSLRSIHLNSSNIIYLDNYLLNLIKNNTMLIKFYINSNLSEISHICSRNKKNLFYKNQTLFDNLKNIFNM